MKYLGVQEQFVFANKDKSQIICLERQKESAHWQIRINDGSPLEFSMPLADAKLALIDSERLLYAIACLVRTFNITSFTKQQVTEIEITIVNLLGATHPLTDNLRSQLRILLNEHETPQPGR